MNRKYVPAALRAEVSEYSSLLRALQTNNALDLVSRLTKRPRVEVESAVSTNDGDSDGDEDLDVPPSTNSSGSEVEWADKGARASRKRKRGDAPQGRVRDKWTRWPLLASDVHVPEWGIEDEIKVLATHIMKAHHRSQDPAPQPTHDDELDGQNVDDIEDEILESSCLDALTLGSSAMLSQILALLVAYVPLSEKSMQNRIVPIDSESVLNIVKAHDLFDEKTIERVQRRLAPFRPSSESQGISSAEPSLARKRRKVIEDEFCFLKFPRDPTNEQSLEVADDR